jgi:sulfonate transport system permease protein
MTTIPHQQDVATRKPFAPSFWLGLLTRPSGLRKAMLPLAIIAVWQALAAYGVINPQTMPAPSTVASSFWQLIVTDQLWPNLVISLERVVFGLAAGVAIGTALALSAGLSRLGEDMIDPTVQMARTLPHLALIPLMILWFGIGETPKLVLIGLGSSFPIYLNLYASIRGADRKLLEAASMLGLTRAETIWHVVLPAALPGFLVGLRQALGIAWITLVVAEQINASAGIGYLVMNARDFLRTDIIFDGLLVYALLGLTTDQLVRFIEARALVWRPSTLARSGDAA